MDIQRDGIGTVPDGSGGTTTVHSYTLDTGHDLAIEVWTYGATLVEVRTPDRRGRTANVVRRLPRPADNADRRKNAYHGATVGRYCRCVAGAVLHLDGVPHRLDRNAGDHHIHGGTDGFDRRVWTAEAERDDDRLVLALRLVSPDGDQGYPGELHAETRYVLEEGRLTFEHSATTTASTAVGVTNHAFWNLAGAGVVDEHVLAVNAERYVAFDAELIPEAGPPVPAGGTSLDYRSPRALGSHRIDNFFVLDDRAWAADLVEPSSGRAMRVVTDEPGVGVYTADHYREPRTGICLETGPWPDAPNRPDFPSARLYPGQRYHRRTTHEFSVR
jgi:aldose 1-epimerase